MMAYRNRFFLIPLGIIIGLLFWFGLTPGVGQKIVGAVSRRMRIMFPRSAPCPGCNIVIVNIDTLRPSNMPCYGYVRNTSPNLCAYANSNMRFSNFYTQTPFTLDSHMSIFTGLFPSSHQVTEALKDTLNPEIPIFTETLDKNGYRTIWVGATDDINLPLDRGLGRGFDEFHQADGNSPDWESDYSKLLPELLGDTPTFMFIHSYGVHSPYLVGKGPYRFIQSVYPGIPLTEEEFYPHSRDYYEFVISEFTSRLNASSTAESKQRNGKIVSRLEQALKVNDLDKARQITWEFPDYENYSLYMTWYYLHIQQGDEAVLEYLKTLYDERIYQVDRQLASLFKFLNRPDVKNNTIVIILSDNGEEFMEHGSFDHGTNIYNTATHAPFILSVPGMKQGVYHELFQAVDIVPTLLDLVGIVPEGPLDGVSMLPVMKGRAPSYTGDRYLIGQYRGGDIISIRNSRWKMYKNFKPDQYVELYDLMKDPLEQHNVLGDHLDIARLLDAALIKTLEASPKYASTSGEFPSWLDDAKRHKLMFEGYF